MTDESRLSFVSFDVRATTNYYFIHLLFSMNAFTVSLTTSHLLIVGFCLTCGPNLVNSQLNKKGKTTNPQIWDAGIKEGISNNY